MNESAACPSFHSAFPSGWLVLGRCYAGPGLITWAMAGLLIAGGFKRSDLNGRTDYTVSH
uniref:Uncharacterized protein n=1 Tax=Picea glauca TaxID=3330 RepID=A0A101LY02_PICGL|nr:hypothetical protein ABT39_MTgene5614 [Picea glauca]